MSKSEKVGYARVSSTDQNTAIQEQALTAAGCSKVFSEQVTGTTTEGRDQLAQALDYVREGDTLVITRIDRLARSLRDLQNIVHQLSEKGVALQATEQPIDTATPAGKAFLSMLGVFAEFETNLRKERQAEGIAKAKAGGKYKGRLPTDPATIATITEQVSQGIPVARACRDAGISRQTFYKAKRAA